MRVVLAGGVTISARAGSFRGHGQVVIRLRPAPSLPFGGSLTAAGAGVDVAFEGVTLARPLMVTFRVGHKPRPGDVPVVAHHLPDGAWDLSVASLASGRMTIRARSFSLHVPGWLDPSAWMRWLGDRLASLVGGRTAPINCAGGGPAWASVVKHTDEAHTCLSPNVDPASHAVRAEIQIKSNRGTALEVDVPPGADYTWVQDQPWALRSWLWAHVIHQNPSLMALLPAGATMTAGYLRPGADENFDFQVVVSYWSLKYSLFSDVVDALAEMGADATGIFTLYVMTKCSGTADPDSLSVHRPLSTATFGSVMTCILSTTLGELASPAKALGAARSLLGPGADQADLATVTKELTAVGGKLLVLGWVLQLWPVLQLGWGGSADVVHDLLTGGTSTLIDLHLAGAGSAMSTFIGSWYVHDGDLCVGDTLVLPSSNTSPKCSGASSLGWTSWWLGCGSYPSASVPVCDGWAELSFAPGPGGTIVGTVQKVFYTTENNAVIPGYQQAGSLAPGDTFELQRVDTGLLKTTYLHTHLSKDDLKYGNPYWCGPGISQANQFKCGA
jgi:hypothetical protein